MTQAKEHDIAIVGGGPGGYVAALRAAQLGANVAVIEKDRLGGTCLNRGCIPTKALAKSAEAFLEVRHSSDFGVETAGIQVNFARMMQRKQQIVDSLVEGIAQLLKAGNVTLYNGTGRIVSPHQVTVNGQEVKAQKLVIATGSVPARVPIPGLDLPGVVTSDELLEIKEIPESLVIIGAGVIGMEFACIFAALGTKVTVIEMLPQILPPVDEEIARRFSQVLRGQGIQVHVSSRVKEIAASEAGPRVLFEGAKGEQSIEAAMVLVAVGRAPYTEGLGLAELGVAMDRRAVAVNDYLETNVPDVYAIGDVTGRIMLAHVASYQGELAVENALGRRHAADYRAVPNCIFTIPEIAGAGMTEREAKEQSIPYQVSRFPFSALGRAQTMGETIGTVKIICESPSGKVLGMHIMGPHATDLIAEGCLAIQLGATAKDIAHTIHAHPTLPEAVREAALGQLDGALHLRKM